MKLRISLATLALTLTFAHADISMPVKDNFYDKLGRGLANVFLAPAEVLDSIYTLNELEGPTVAWSKGVVQGFSRAGMDFGLGVADIATSPFPTGPEGTFETDKHTPYDSMVVNTYPPADLTNFY